MEDKELSVTDLEIVNKEQQELELQVPKTLRTEFNFLKYPFFDLARRNRRNEIKIEEAIQTKDGTFNMLWFVTKGIDFPGDFEKRLHRAIEQIINITPKPIENPLRLGKLRYIAKLMGFTEGGYITNRIRQAFDNIISATIKTHGTFQVKENNGKKYMDDTFHLYDRVRHRGEVLPDGEVADCTYLWLGSWYLNNINQNYVVPLDWHFYTKLDGTITTRMYEFLSIYFFVALERARAYQDVQYSKICNFFPLTKQYPRWKAKKQLKQAHDILMAEGYVAQSNGARARKKGIGGCVTLLDPKLNTNISETSQRFAEWLIGVVEKRLFQIADVVNARSPQR